MTRRNKPSESPVNLITKFIIKKVREMINGDYIMVIAPDDYTGKRYREKYCYEHHLVYWKTYGVLPKENEIIHHIDGNKYNNSIDNLKLLPRKEHVSMHTRNRGKTMLLLRCPVCGKEFEREKRKTHITKGYKASYCSKDCSNQAKSFRSLNDTHFEKAISENVVREYKSIPHEREQVNERKDQ